MKTECQGMVSPLKSVLLKRPEEAFRSEDVIEREWQALGYVRRPDLSKAAEQHRQFVAVLEDAGVETRFLPAANGTGLDSIYVRDPVLITDSGAVILRMGKEARRGEGPAVARAFEEWGVPIIGKLDPPATAEAGDMVWLDPTTLIMGRSFRTNEAGIGQLAAILEPLDVRIIPVHLPHWHGPEEVLHLMSFLSPLDTDLAVVYRPLLPVPLFELLSDNGVELVDVPDEEYDSMGCNVLAVAPRQIVMVGGNPATRTRLESAGCQVTEIDGSEICLPGAGGPTCLTRPLRRS